MRRLVLIFSAAELALVMSASGCTGSAAAQTEEAPVLRGRALQIVDPEGRVRASIDVYPADPSVTLPDGRPLPDTVVFRLIDPNGRPSVKLATSEYGAVLALGGEADPIYLLLSAQQASPSITFMTKDGRQQVIQP